MLRKKEEEYKKLQDEKRAKKLEIIKLAGNFE